MKKKQTIMNNIALNYILIQFCLFFLTFSQFYNNHTRCSSNPFTFSGQFSNFMVNMQYRGLNITEVGNLLGSTTPLSHFGQKVIQPSTINYQNHRCKNFFMQKNICCRYSDLDRFTIRLIAAFNKTYYYSKHPMVDYIYKIYDLSKNLSSSCLNNYTFTVPQRNNYTYTNATQPLADLISSINNQMKVIKQHQINFINQTSCLFCVGIQDMQTFIHPHNSDYLKVSKRVIYNQEYFINITNMIAAKLWKSKSYADQIQKFIVSTLRPKSSSLVACVNLINLIKNDTQILKRKLCDTYQECLRFAQKYIGDPAAPGYSKFFTYVQLNKTMTKTNFRVVTTQNCGFKGNLTYERYINYNAPTVYIKGNQYTYI